MLRRHCDGEFGFLAATRRFATAATILGKPHRIHAAPSQTLAVATPRPNRQPSRPPYPLGGRRCDYGWPRTPATIWPAGCKTVCVADPVSAADLGHRQPRLVLLQNPNDLLLAEPALAHRPSPSSTDPSVKPGLFRGQGHAVFACVTLIANDISKLRLRLVRQDADGIWQETELPPLATTQALKQIPQAEFSLIADWVMQ